MHPAYWREHWILNHFVIDLISNEIQSLCEEIVSSFVNTELM